MALQGQPEHPGMPLLADGGESNAARRRTAQHPPGLLVADDFPDLQRLRPQPVQEDRAGPAEPG